ncbi:hypothetical protein [Sulfurovum sp. AR]|uniref:hypothetical protein n=1 Tax=Sulfurovum sp. AR TaxID=1165841 RepID=UPI00025C4D48|nr:hypothetical protein [Sulfurovum sp. AR]EIF51388.1 hypothetical protein SULAR_04052 [Sulfurovum sp. AR]
MEKAFWLSYDLGVKGDYTGLYEWLDNVGAKECGDNLAFFLYEINKDDDIRKKIKEDIQSKVNIEKRDRIYLVYREPDGTRVRGTFIFGRRKASPWEGFGDKTVEIDG